MELSPKIQQRIHVLPESVKRKIAAGEVIDGPYSVVKELIENAIDALSTEIQIEIEESGLKRIAVTDNGIGMYKEDIPLSVEEHATSKIKNIDDIYSILTMGFRGEALSSIAEVSKLTIFSRTEDEPVGGKLVIQEEKKELFDWAGPSGTTVIVENLFFNTPARKKFLKGLKHELNRIKDVIFTFAIANPNIQFKLNIDNKIAFSFEPTDTINRIRDIYGNELADHLIGSHLSDIECTFECFCSTPDYYRSNRSLQFLFVNKRPVQFPYFSFILQQAYQTLLQKGQYPVAFIFCNIKPDLVDVNVHPAKREVRFFDSNYIHSMLYNVVSKAISGTIHTLPLKHDNNTVKHTTQTFTPNLQDAYQLGSDDTASLPYPVKKDTSESSIIIKEMQKLYSQLHQKEYTIIGTIFGSYVLIQKDETLYIIDFHAAHEKKLFEYLKSINVVNGIQKLLVPVIIELSPDLVMRIDSLNDVLHDYGILIDKFDETSIVVNAVPDFCNTNDIEGLVRDIIDSFSENNQIDDIKIKIIEKIACHSAKRAHDILTNDDMVAIADFVFSTDTFRCPHGRPFVYAVSKSDLERFFKRS